MARYNFMQILCNKVFNSYIHFILEGHTGMLGIFFVFM